MPNALETCCPGGGGGSWRGGGGGGLGGGVMCGKEHPLSGKEEGVWCEEFWEEGPGGTQYLE